MLKVNIFLGVCIGDIIIVIVLYKGKTTTIFF